MFALQEKLSERGNRGRNFESASSGEAPWMRGADGRELCTFAMQRPFVGNCDRNEQCWLDQACVDGNAKVSPASYIVIAVSDTTGQSAHQWQRLRGRADRSGFTRRPLHRLDLQTPSHR